MLFFREAKIKFLNFDRILRDLMDMLRRLVYLKDKSPKDFETIIKRDHESEEGLKEI
jgi:hypothetical protein